MVEMENGIRIEIIKEVLVRDGLQRLNSFRKTANELLFMESIFLDKLAEEDVNLVFINVESASRHIDLIKFFVICLYQVLCYKDLKLLQLLFVL